MATLRAIYGKIRLLFMPTSGHTYFNRGTFIETDAFRPTANTSQGTFCRSNFPVID